jgi:hypothetical protein
MPVSRALRRLLRVRELEEEQNRLALESALSEQRRLEQALAATEERERQGRRLVGSSARTGELDDRLAGIEETRSASRRAWFLVPRIGAATAETERLRYEFLSKRVERRQAETLIEETEASDAVHFSRNNQQALDEWFRSRRPAKEMGPGTCGVRTPQLGRPDTTEVDPGLSGRKLE